MILTKEQAEILTKNQPYNCSLIKQKWSYAILGENLSALGNIITFCSPIKIEKLELSNSLIIAAELPNANMFGGTSFLRLYSSQIGSILSEILHQDCYVNESSIFVNGQQCSIAFIKQVKDSVLFHIIFSIENQTLELFDLPNDEEVLFLIKQKAVDCFHFLTKSIFIETRRDNI